MAKQRPGKETPSEHHHITTPVSVESKPGGVEIGFITLADSLEAIACVNERLSQLGSTVCSETYRVRDERIPNSRGSSRIGFGGVKWNATWEPKGPPTPYYRPPARDARPN